MADIHVYSIGGSGTRFLVGFFGIKENEAHRLHSPENLDRSFFVHRDIYQSLYSLFNKRKPDPSRHKHQGKDFIRIHCRNLGGDYDKIDVNWELEDYLANGEDILRLHEHFNYWLHSGVPFVRLDGLINKEVFRQLTEYLGVDDCYDSLRKQFNISKYVIDFTPNLEKLYGDLRKKLNALPDYHIT
jgi:hypothetical protein